MAIPVVRRWPSVEARLYLKVTAVVFVIIILIVDVKERGGGGGESF